MIEKIMEQTFWNNKILDYAVAVLIFLGSLIVIKLFEHILLKRLKRWAERTSTTIDDFLVGIIEKIIIPFLCFGALYLSIDTLTLNPLLKRIIDIIGLAVLTLFSVRLITVSISYGFEIYLSGRGKSIALERSLNGILRVIKVVVWGMAIAFFLDNLGFKITAVVAGLGIGGIAVAMAAQAVLKDLFSYFSIIFDRPFEIGDFIIIGEYLGTVEQIGIKTTRISSLSGEQLIFSNSDLTDSRVRNYKRMQKRRVPFKFGVAYQTPVEKLKEIPRIIENIVENIEDATFDRTHFFSYGDFSLIFEVVYYIRGSNYNKYMDIQQKVNLALKEEFEKREIEFAYPTQTIYLNKA